MLSGNLLYIARCPLEYCVFKILEIQEDHRDACLFTQQFLFSFQYRQTESLSSDMTVNNPGTYKAWISIGPAGGLDTIDFCCSLEV